MPLEFLPILSILEPPQRRLWDELGRLPNSFVLCGGTAVALQLGHRSSVDFDFVAANEFDPDELCRRDSVPEWHPTDAKVGEHSDLHCRSRWTGSSFVLWDADRSD